MRVRIYDLLEMEDNGVQDDKENYILTTDIIQQGTPTDSPFVDPKYCCLNGLLNDLSAYSPNDQLNPFHSAAADRSWRIHVVNQLMKYVQAATTPVYIWDMVDVYYENGSLTIKPAPKPSAQMTFGVIWNTLFNNDAATTPAAPITNGVVDAALLSKAYQDCIAKLPPAINILKPEYRDRAAYLQVESLNKLLEMVLMAQQNKQSISANDLVTMDYDNRGALSFSFTSTSLKLNSKATPATTHVALSAINHTPFNGANHTDLTPAIPKKPHDQKDNVTDEREDVYANLCTIS